MQIPATQINAEGGYPLAPYAMLQDQRATTVNAGASTSGSWEKRTINTEVVDVDGIASLASSQITLSAGTYDCFINVPSVNSQQAQSRLYNATDAEILVLGGNVYNLGSGGSCDSTVHGRFTVAAGKALEVQCRVNASVSPFGQGIANNFGGTEVYVTAEFWKVA